MTRQEFIEKNKDRIQCFEEEVRHHFKQIEYLISEANNSSVTYRQIMGQIEEKISGIKTALSLQDFLQEYIYGLEGLE